MSDSQLAALLFVQLMCILAVCRALGWFFSRMRQPLVVNRRHHHRLARVMTGPLFSLIWEREGEPAVDAALAAERARPA